jgi:hypothetical protein
MKNSTAKRLKQVPAIIHGGPGAPGSMATVARELASDWGIMEPLQTVTSLERQCKSYGSFPAVSSHQGLRRLMTALLLDSLPSWLTKVAGEANIGYIIDV